MELSHPSIQCLNLWFTTMTWQNVFCEKGLLAIEAIMYCENQLLELKWYKSVRLNSADICHVSVLCLCVFVCRLASNMKFQY